MRALMLLLLVLASGCRADHVKNYGAIPDDGVDDTAAIQAAINAGGVIRFASGVYDVSQTGYAWSLDIGNTSGLSLIGRKGTSLRFADNTPNSVRMISSQTGPVNDFLLANIDLDGNKQGQAPNEHRHGVFLANAKDVRVWNVTAHDFTGDGFYVYDGGSNIVFVDVVSTQNDRNGLTIGGYVDGVTVASSDLFDNAAQQFDSEAGSGDQVDNVSVVGNYIRSPNDFAIAAGGTYYNLGKGWLISGNRIESGGHGMRVIYVDDALIEDNIISSGVGPYAGIQVYNKNNSVVISGNTISSINHGTSGAITVLATTADLYTDTVVVSDNNISAGPSGTVPANGTSLRFQGSRHTIVENNEINGGDIYVRPTFPMESFIANGNTLVNGNLVFQGEIPVIELENNQGF